MCSLICCPEQKLPHVCVKQMSIDTEQFCHEMAQRLCTQAEKKYWFCSDFNVEIIDLCLETNDVVAAAYMLVEADVSHGNQYENISQIFGFQFMLP